jgi:hypothetical protein
MSKLLTLPVALVIATGSVALMAIAAVLLGSTSRNSKMRTTRPNKSSLHPSH